MTDELLEAIRRVTAAVPLSKRRSYGRIDWGIWSPVLDSLDITLYRGPRKCYADELFDRKPRTRIRVATAHMHRAGWESETYLCIAKSTGNDLLVHEVAHHLVNVYGDDGNYYDGDFTELTDWRRWEGHGPQWRETMLRLGVPPILPAMYDPTFAKAKSKDPAASISREVMEEYLRRSGEYASDLALIR